MDTTAVCEILAQLGFHDPVTAVTPFTREEDGSLCSAWRIDGAGIAAVLKKISPSERVTCQTFFSMGEQGVPRIYGLGEQNEESYMLMELFEGETLSHSTRKKLTLGLDTLIRMQEQYWGNTALADAGWTFEKQYASLQKRLPYMEDLQTAYNAYLEANRKLPRTLCNDDLLPFNVLVNDRRAVIIDWEYGGILPYPCALARLLAFGEENTDFMFQMSQEDREFALRYYYDHLIRSKGISWEQYHRTMQLFFFKEYSEWVYLARRTGDFSSPYYEKYYEKAKALAMELGLYKN